MSKQVDNRLEWENKAHELEAQLAQAQQELADANQQLEVLRPGGLYAWKTKYEQAEAALEEIQTKAELLKAANEMLFDWLDKSLRGELKERPVNEVLAEL